MLGLSASLPIRPRRSRSWKNRGVLREEAGLKYAAIHQHRSAHSIASQCAVLGVSRSCHYRWQRRRDSVSQRLAERAKRDAKVVELFEAKKRRLASLRLREELKAEGMAMNRKTVAESMRPVGAAGPRGQSLSAYH